MDAAGEIHAKSEVYETCEKAGQLPPDDAAGPAPPPAAPFPSSSRPSPPPAAPRATPSLFPVRCHFSPPLRVREPPADARGYPPHSPRCPLSSPVPLLRLRPPLLLLLLMLPLLLVLLLSSPPLMGAVCPLTGAPVGGVEGGGCGERASNHCQTGRGTRGVVADASGCHPTDRMRKARHSTYIPPPP